MNPKFGFDSLHGVIIPRFGDEQKIFYPPAKLCDYDPTKRNSRSVLVEKLILFYEDIHGGHANKRMLLRFSTMGIMTKQRTSTQLFKTFWLWKNSLVRNVPNNPEFRLRSTINPNHSKIVDSRCWTEFIISSGATMTSQANEKRKTCTHSFGIMVTRKN